jgi:hypothetical protein
MNYIIRRVPRFVDIKWLAVWLFCLGLLCLVGCASGDKEDKTSVASEDDQIITDDDDSDQEPLPTSMKGYELYSWSESDVWYFTLITGTNSLKTYDEITSDRIDQETGDWIRIKVESVEQIKDVLKRLPKGASIGWTIRRVPGFSFPPEQMVDEIKQLCESLELNLFLST